MNIRPTGASGVSGAGAVTSGPVGSGGGSSAAAGTTLSDSALGAGLSEGFPQGPLGELLRYPDERKRKKKDALELAEEMAEEAGLEFADRAALARAAGRLVDATHRYAQDVYKLAVSLVEGSNSEAVDIVHEAFGNRSWKDLLDEASAPLIGLELNVAKAQDFILATESVAERIESTRASLPQQSA
jgi:hypothetical protein